MARLTKTYTGDFTTFIAKKIIELALKQAKKKGKSTQDVEDDDVVSGGGQSNPVNPITSLVPVRGGAIAKSQDQDPRISKITNIINNPSATAGEKDAARAALKRVTRKIPNAERGFIPKGFSRIFNNGIEVKETKLGVFLEKVALSLSSSINTINEKMDETNENVIAAKDGIDKTYRKLETHSDTLADKLDAIIDALRYSNKSAEEKRDKNEASAKESFMQQQVDLSNANRILMQDMDRQEIRDMQAQDLAEDDRGPIGMDDGGGIDPDDLPSLDRGGIVSGPDSGYLAVLHGDEAVIPLDNNYTQGQPSAVGKEPISQMPMMAERGITPGDNPSSMKPKFTINSPSSSPVLNIGGKMSGGEDLAKAIQLPAKMAGLVTGGLMTNILTSAILPPGIVNHMKNLTNPVMEAFGVGNLADKLKEDSANKLSMEQQRQSVLAGGANREGREKGILQRIKEFIFGEGGGNMTYRGMGGKTYVNNRTSGTGGYGGYGTGGWPFGGKKPSDNIKELRYRSDHPLGTEQPNPFKPGSTLYKNFEKMRELDRYGVLDISSSGGDSQFFAKNVTYDNAFDYNKFNSPEHGLNTSNIAYNMSMEDEVDSITDAISNPEEQIVLNNQTANAKSDNQMEYSAIQVRGNPLKQGTYVSPYSV